MPRVEWNGDILIAAARGMAKEIAMRTAEEVKLIAVDRAPIEESILRQSAEVSDIGNGAEISFNTPYAVVMHEWEGYVPSHEGTGPNYLRGPLQEMEEEYHRRIEAGMKAIFG